MDKLTRQFFGDAKKMGMHPSEKAQVWDQISMRASSKPVLLSSREKADGFDRLVAHMKSNPVQPQRHPLRHFIALHRIGAMAMCAVLLIGAGGGGVAYAAEEAMPEDILYPVKLHFNERLIGAFHRTPEHKAHWEQRKLERRLREAEHLSEQTAFTDDRREMLQQRIEKRIEMFHEHISSLPEERRQVLEAQFEKRFAQHEQFLHKIEEGTASPQQIRQFKEYLRRVRPEKRKDRNSVLRQPRHEWRSER